MTPEGRVKQDIKAGLKSLGKECWFFAPVQTGYGQRALDFIGCYRGQFFSIEAKRNPKTKPTAMQAKILNDIRQAGGITLVASSWSDVAKALDND